MQSIPWHRHQSSSDSNNAESVWKGKIWRISKRSTSNIAVGVHREEDFAASFGAAEENFMLDWDDFGGTWSADLQHLHAATAKRDFCAHPELHQHSGFWGGVQERRHQNLHYQWQVRKSRCIKDFNVNNEEISEILSWRLFSTLSAVLETWTFT